MRPLKTSPIATAALLLASALYLLFLLTLPRDTVFYSGDGGLKYLMAKQFVNGKASSALELHPARAEAGELWAEGLYPFGPPFAYPVDDQWLVSFPIYFPLATAPFFGALGWHGLYVLPAGAILLLWTWLANRGHSAGLLAPSTCAGLLSLVFASPLTLYAAMFWEHAPAAFLASLPLVLLLPCKRLQTGRAPVAFGVLFGLFSGMGVFLRPEIMVFIPCVIAVVLWMFRWERLRLVSFFTLGFALSLAAFFAANHAFYGTLLGQHAAQVLEGSGLSVARTLKYANLLYLKLAEHTPWLAGILVGLPWLLFRPLPWKREIIACLLAIVVSIPVVAAIVPNTGGKQWGPRYLLILVPWCSVLLALLVDACLRLRGRPSQWILLLLTVTLALGLRVNAWKGTLNLARDYQNRVFPALQLVQGEPEHFVAVSHQWIAQELVPLFATKTVLWPQNKEHFARLKSKLREGGARSFLYVSFHGEDSPRQLGSVTKVGVSESYLIRRVTFAE